MSRSVRHPPSPSRRAALRVAFVLGCAAAVSVFADAGAPDVPGPDAPKPQAPAAVSRAAPPRARVRAVAVPIEEPAPPVPVPDAAPEPVTEERKIRLVDEAGRPVIGAPIDFDGGPDPETNAAGEVTYIAAVGAPASLVYDDGFVRRRVEVREAITELVVARADVVVQTIDGFTGTPLPTGGVSLRCNWSGTPSATEAQSCGAVLLSAPAEERKLRLRIATTGTATHASAGDLDWNRPISITARRVRIDVPVFPLRNVALRPVSEEGENVSEVAFAGATLLTAYRAETDRGFQAAAAGRDGDALLVQAPRIPANFATFGLRSPVDEATDTVLAGTSVPIALGAADPEPATEVPVVRVSASRRGGRRSLSAGCGCRGSRETVPVKVRVLRRDGSPAPHVSVRADYDTVTTGSDGTATVRCSEAALLVYASAHGFLPSCSLVRLDSLAPDSVVEIVESAPRRVRVVVVDGDDRPVPSARVFAESTGCAPVRTIAQMDGDTEIGTPRTDADGAIVLDVCDGTIRYDVSLAGAATSVESDAAEVRVVLGATPPTAK